jgi:hypothetical protein
MKKVTIGLGLIILIYGIYFYCIPLFNMTKDSITDINIFKTYYTTILWNLFGFILTLLCGIGLIKLNDLVRLIWLAYSFYIVLIGVLFYPLSTINGIRLGLYKFSDIPIDYWIKSYGLLLLAIYSVIFLNLPKVKEYFKRKKGTAPF